MTTPVKIRYSRTTTTPPPLLDGELAWSSVSDVLFIGDNGSVISIAGSGAFAPINSPVFTGTPTAPTPNLADNSNQIATTAFVKSQTFGNQTITLSGDATGSGTTSITVTLANTGVAAGTYTKYQVNEKGLIVGTATLVEADIPSLTAAKISDFNAAVQLNRLDQLAAPTANVNLNNQKIVGLANPSNATDAATKGYVDSFQQGLDLKGSVKAATTTNIALNGLQTIDGVVLQAGDRVLVKNQTATNDNGIYIVDSGAWYRSSDANTSDLVTSGMFCFVESGTINADTGWVLITDGAISIGVTPLSFTQFSSSGSITAGAGLTQTGGVIDVVGTANRITVNANSVDIAENYAGQTSIVTVGTVTTGTWQAAPISLQFGGLGADLSAIPDGTLFKKVGTAFVAAIPHVDYLNGDSTIDGGSF